MTNTIDTVMVDSARASVGMPEGTGVSVCRRIAEADRSKLARELGVDRSYVSLVLSGKKCPSLPMAARMADGLGVSLGRFWKHWVGMGGTVPVN
jgi:transcriptional regulator with XRE-family HTH domain